MSALITMTTWVAELALGIAVRPSRDLPSMTPWHKSTGILPVLLVHDTTNSSIACLEIPHVFARVTNFPHGLAARLSAYRMRRGLRCSSRAPLSTRPCVCLLTSGLAARLRVVPRPQVGLFW